MKNRSSHIFTLIKMRKGLKLLCLAIAFMLICGIFTACNRKDPAESAASTLGVSGAVTESLPSAPAAPDSKESSAVTTDGDLFARVSYESESYFAEFYQEYRQNYSLVAGYQEGYARKFLDYLAEGNYLGVAAFVRATDPEAYRFIENVVIDRYEIIERPDDISYYGAQLFKVLIEVSQSDTELFPVGDSYWVLLVNFGEGSYMPLFVKYENEIELEAIVWPVDRNNLCYNFALYFNVFTTCDDFNAILADKMTYNGFLHSAMHFYGYYLYTDPAYKDNIPYYQPGGVTAMRAFIKDTTGISDIDFTNYQWGAGKYDPKTDAITVDCAHGGKWLYWHQVSEAYDEQTGLHSAILDFYSDTSLFVKARTVKYVYRQNDDGTFTMLSTELLYDSGYGMASGAI